MFSRLISHEYAEIRRGAICMPAEVERVIPYVSQVIQQEFADLDQVDKVYAAKRIAASAAVAANNKLGYCSAWNAEKLSIRDFQQHVDEAIYQTDLTNVRNSFKRNQ